MYVDHLEADKIYMSIQNFIINGLVMAMEGIANSMYECADYDHAYRA